MNRHTRTHRLFLDHWAAERPRSVEWVFTLPAVPAGTFRSNAEIGASNLYDVASYVLAALGDAGVDLAGVRLDRVDHAGRPDMERLHLSGQWGDLRFAAVTGVAPEYENTVRLGSADGTGILFSPFVYGRSGSRRILDTRAGGVTESVIEDVNAFEAMLATPLSHWRETARARGRRMVELTRHLERLGRDLARFRAVAA